MTPAGQVTLRIVRRRADATIENNGPIAAAVRQLSNVIETQLLTTARHIPA